MEFSVLTPTCAATLLLSFKTSNSDSSDLFHYHSSQFIKYLTFENLCSSNLKNKSNQVSFFFPFLYSWMHFPPSAVIESIPPSNSLSLCCWLSICCWGFGFFPAIPHSCLHLLVSFLAISSLELHYLRQHLKLTITQPLVHCFLKQ